MPENLELIACREAIELQHDRRIERGDVAMPDVARNAGEENIGVTAFKSAHHRHLRNRVTLPEILAQEERVDARGIPAHDHVLIVIRKNLRLDEVAGTEQIGDGSRFAHSAYRTLSELFVALQISAFQFLARK